MPYLAAVLLVAWAGVASAGNNPEQRCTDLGANCICGETLNTASIPVGSLSFLHNPANSTVKECVMDATAPIGDAILNTGSGAPSTDATVLSRLPAGHSVTHFYRSPGAGVLDIGTIFSRYSNVPTARRAWRGYVYLSDDFEFSTGGTAACLNRGKMLGSYDQGPIISNGGQWHIYNWNGLSCSGGGGIPGGCCAIGPGSEAGAQQALTQATVKGKWHRIEWVQTRTGAGVTRIQVFWQNVTDAGPEWTMMDTSIPTSQGGASSDWDTGDASMTCNVVDSLAASWFTNGTCAGHFGLTHMVLAAWSTDAGQRIGAATEVEGGAGPTTPAVPVLESVTTP